MPRVTGVPAGSVDTDAHEITFDLDTADGSKINCIADYPSAARIVSALGKMISVLREALRSKQAFISVSAEKVAEAHVQKDRWLNVVLLELTTPEGVPYTFEIPTENAAEIADRLKIESAKPTEVGRG